MSWQEMRIPKSGPGHPLPGSRGRYLLWLEPPLLEGDGHYVHFSWKENSFCIRDFLQQLELRQSPGLAPRDVWEAATDRIPCKGDLYVPVENVEFWTQKLTDLTEQRNQGQTSGLWSRLSGKFPGTGKSRGIPRVPPPNGTVGDVYGRFKAAWESRSGFEVIERTRGCSARYRGTPLLWVYPTYFQVAPQGKGNTRYMDALRLRHEHFPELRNNGTIGFDSEHFSWQRFEAFTAGIRAMVDA